MISRIESLPGEIGCKIILESPMHVLYVFPTHNQISFRNVSMYYRMIDFDIGQLEEWHVSSPLVYFPPCLVEVSADTSTSITQALRLSDVSNGWVIKFLFNHGENELENSIYILLSGIIRWHPHPDIKQISEGYRFWDFKTGHVGPWQVVGPGFSSKRHCVPFRPGIQIVEESKRGPGIEAWPELQQH